MEYTVRTRYGWGWEVVGDGFQSAPIDSAISAEAMAEEMNSGKSAQESAANAGLEFSNGRYHTK